MKKLKTAALLTALLLIAGLGCFANALVGNPISKMLATKAAKDYLDETYRDTSFMIETVSYSFKDGQYYAHIKSPSSADTYFSLSFNMGGKLTGDNYASRVSSGENTADRLARAYRELTDSVFESSAFPFACDIAFGKLQFGDADAYSSHNACTIMPKNLELDRLYDIRELGAKIGHLTVYAEDSTVSIERAAEIMLEIRRLMDEGGAPFYAMDFVLQYPKPEGDGGRPEGRVDVLHFLYTDIYESGMVQRVNAAKAAADAWYAAMDQKK